MRQVKSVSIPHLSPPVPMGSPISFLFGEIPTDPAVRVYFQTHFLTGHAGLDYAVKEGTPVQACYTGTVIHAGEKEGYGITIVMQHTWGTSLYGHLSTTCVQFGTKIKKTTVIGYSGATGFVTGPHLHFAIQPKKINSTNGYLGFIDPLPYLST